MPLNMQEQNENQEETSGGTPQPILHDAEIKEGHSRKALVIVFILVALVATGYLLFKFNVFSGKQETASTAVVNLAQVDTAGPPPLYEPGKDATTATKQPEPAQNPSVKEPAPATVTSEKPREEIRKTEARPKETAAPVRIASVEAGEFTIYTGTFRSKANADREVRRLTRAGAYPIVKETRGLFSVSVGSYKTKAEAETFVARNKELFPNGYHVGKAK